jgi:hypothetical protein
MGKDPDYELITGQLVAKLSAIKDIKMRTYLLAERLKMYPPVVVVELLHLLSDKASRRDDYREVLLSLVDLETIREILGNQRMSDIYSRAREQGYDEVVRILSHPGSHSQQKVPQEEGVEVRSFFDDTTVGERRALAKGQDRDLLERLLYDQNPLVIRVLLLNPRITERDVIKLAARRPNSPRVLQEVFASRRWIVRYGVKVALSRNPYTPPKIAVRLVSFLMGSDLAEMTTDDTLHPELREAARAEYRRRQGTSLDGCNADYFTHEEEEDMIELTSPKEEDDGQL